MKCAVDPFPFVPAMCMYLSVCGGVKVCSWGGSFVRK